MEKIVDGFVKSTSLVEMPLSKFQFAYQTGKSTITALQSVASKIEKSFQAKEIAVVAFLDIEKHSITHPTAQCVLQWKQGAWINALLNG